MNEIHVLGQPKFKLTNTERLVVAIVVTYNGALLLTECLNSLLQGDYPIKTILIDNASRDNTISIAKSFTNIEIICLNKNVGFGSANNIGICRALELGANYILLLNQDAWIAPDILTQMISVMEEQPELGITSPLHWQSNGIYLDTNFQSYLYQGAGNNFADFIHGNLQPVYSVPFVNAAIWLISRKCIQQIGGFDPLFFMYAEDDDYCRRLLLSGLKIGVVPTANAYHARAKSTKSSTNWQMLNSRSERIKSILLLDLKDPKYSFPNILLCQVYRNLRLILSLLLHGNFREIFAHWLAFAKIVPLFSTILSRRQQSTFIPITEISSAKSRNFK